MRGRGRGKKFPNRIAYRLFIARDLNYMYYIHEKRAHNLYIEGGEGGGGFAYSWTFVNYLFSLCFRLMMGTCIPKRYGMFLHS